MNTQTIALHPDREAELKVGDKTYRLRFGIRELLRAETVFSRKALDGGAAAGIGKLISVMFNDTLDSLLGTAYVMLERNHPGIQMDEVYAIAERDLGGLDAATRHVLGVTSPKADPNEPPAPSTETSPVTS